MGVETDKMKTISSFLMLFTIVFIASTGMLLIMSDIGVKNDNLSDEAKTMVANLSTYQTLQAEYEFSNYEANYTLTGYETIAPEDKDNAESKGVISVFLFLGDAFIILPALAHAMLPFLPLYAFAWLEGILLAVGGYFFTIAVYNAWKGRRT